MGAHAKKCGIPILLGQSLIEVNMYEYNNEGKLHLADIIRGWLLETYPDFTIVKDVYAKLHLKSSIKNFDWLALNIVVSRSTLNPKIMIHVERDDFKTMHSHEFIIFADSIKDCEKPDDINFAYDSAFIEKFKAKVDKIISGQWFSQTPDDIS